MAPSRGVPSMGQAFVLLITICLDRGGALAEVDQIYMAPWYCPPPQPEARSCVGQYRFNGGGPPPHVEEFVLPFAVRTVIALSEEPEVDDQYLEPAKALLKLLEAIRLILCVVRFQQCYERQVAAVMEAELCTLAALQQFALRGYGGVVPGDENVCVMFFQRGDGGALLRAISQPLQGLVAKAFPEAAPPVLGNNGMRFDYEHFFEARGRIYTRRVKEGIGDRALTLVHPALFSPGGVCGNVSRGLGPPLTNGPDVDEALAQLVAANVELSGYVVNLGAADGECGAADDWNADPANCLISRGSSAILIEGNPEFYPKLRQRFGDRSNVTMVLDFVALDELATVLRRDMEAPTSSSSPDLLKVDLDHADCLYLAEALRAVSPKLIHIEYQSLIPPPLDYVQQYQPGLLSVGLAHRKQPPLAGRSAPARSQGLGAELPGCSLSAFLKRAPDYALVVAGDEEALLVRRDLHAKLGIGPPPSAWSSWVQGSMCHPLRGVPPGAHSYGFDFRMLADVRVPREERLRALQVLLRERGAGPEAFALDFFDD
eukprot:TRINITY_DN22393_c0_g3_i1.p1 TRINITY_DN22393_c0_g3~~TRINITY_DN22393_c0_g3_i1.p1  ORF type:complete len:560 (-),score=110.23 TRINITY_DN22393_c0_g3_i1:97-1728(-)